MSLNTVFRFHAILAFSYAVLLGLFPNFTLSLLSSQSLNPVGTDITRIFGAAVLLIGILTWGAISLTDQSARKLIAQGLIIYTSLGAIISLMGQLAGNWNTLGWSNVVVYVVIAVGYAYALYGKRA